jgi:hypothetical protein
MSTTIGHNLDWINSAYKRQLSGILQADSNEKLLLCHFGNLTQSKIESLLKLAESAVLESGDKRQTMKRLCVLMVEIMQNIAIHATLDNQGQMHSYIILSRSNSSYRVISGSLIMESEIPLLNQKLSTLNAMDENALRKLYIETLCNDEFSQKGGAGLGLLTIAKKASDKLKFDLNTLDNHLGYFQLEVPMSVE